MAAKTALLSFYTPDYQPLHDVNGPVKDRYCARHGYWHIVYSSSYRDTPGYYAYDRLAYLRDIMFGDTPDEGLEVVAVLNGHAQIMTHSIRIEDFLEDGKDFYIAADVNGLNAGVFIVRKSEWLKTWLDFLLSKEQEYSGHDWHEQKAMQDNWERPEFKDHIKIVDQWLLNSYLWQAYNWSTETPGQFRPGQSWVLHVPGRDVRANPAHNLMQSRVALFSSWEVKSHIRE